MSDKTEINSLNDEEIKKISGGQQTCGEYSSAGFPQSDAISPTATKSWFSTADQAALCDK